MSTPWVPSSTSSSAVSRPTPRKTPRSARKSSLRRSPPSHPLDRFGLRRVNLRSCLRSAPRRWRASRMSATPQSQSWRRTSGAFIEGRVVSAYQYGPLAELRKWVRRNPGFAIAVGISILALLGALLWSQQLARQRQLDADMLLLPNLRSEAETLWPALPENATALSNWLARASALLSREDSHRERPLPADPFERARRERFLIELEGFQDPKTGLMSNADDAMSADHSWSMPRRLRFAERLHNGLAEGGEWHDQWNEAIEAIEHHPKYGG